MAQHNVGDVISDCPGCESTDTVLYRGNNEGVCSKCGSVYEVIFDAEEETAPPPPPPAPLPKAQKKQPARSSDVGKLSDVSAAPIDFTRKVAGSISDNLDNAIADAKALGIPEYMLKSRPWRWAHELNRTGNPYREDTKNWQIFNAIANTNGIQVEDLVAYLAPKMGDKVSYLLTIYEVVTQCVAAGLLVMNPANRMVQLCQSQPKPAPLP